MKKMGGRLPDADKVALYAKVMKLVVTGMTRDQAEIAAVDGMLAEAMADQKEIADAVYAELPGLKPKMEVKAEPKPEPKPEPVAPVEKAPAADKAATPDLKPLIVALIKRKGVADNRNMVDEAVERAKDVTAGTRGSETAKWFTKRAGMMKSGDPVTAKILSDLAAAVKGLPEIEQAPAREQTPAQKAAFQEMLEKQRERREDGSMFSRSAPDKVTVKIARNGIPVFGNSVVAIDRPRRYSDDKESIVYTIFDPTKVREFRSAGQSDMDGKVGIVELDVSPDGIIRGLSGIVINNELRTPRRDNQGLERVGYGEKVVRAILSTLPDGVELKIHGILPEARGFWEKMGVRIEPGKFTEDGYVTRRDYEQKRTSIQDGGGTSGLVFSRGSGDAELSNDRGREAGTDGRTREAGPALDRTAGRPRALSLRDAQAIYDRIAPTFKNLPKVTLLNRPGELPDRVKGLRDQIRKVGAWNDVEGAYHDGEIFIFADNIADESRMEHVLFEHEVRHYGFRGTLGKDLDAALNGLLMRNPALRAKATALRTRLGLKSNITAVEEVLADLPMNELVQLKGVDRLIALLRDWLAQHNFKALAKRMDDWLVNRVGEQTAADAILADMVRAARDFARNGKPSRSNLYMGGTRFVDESGKGQTQTEAFRSLASSLGSAASARDVMSVSDKAIKDGLQRHAEALSNFFESEASLTQSNRLRNIPSSVVSHVVGVARSDDKILGVIVRSLPVDVVNFLARKKVSAEQLLRDKSMLEDVLPVDRAANVPLSINETAAISLVRSVAQAAAKISTALTDGTLKGGSADSAILGDSVLGGQDVLQNSSGLGNDKVEQTKTPAFLNWFKGSKVVDSDGAPLVVYHGTTADFDAFQEGTGFFSSNPDEANIYGGMDSAGANVMPAYVSIKNPRYLEVSAASKDKVYDALSMLNSDQDGVIVRENGKVRWAVVANPEQIKSATGNSGQFSPSNPDIRFSRGAGGGVVTPTPFHEENGRLRERDRTTWDKAKKYLRRQFSPGGLLPSGVFEEKVSRDSQFNAVEFDARNHVGKFESAIRVDYKKKFVDLPADVKAKLSQALTGDVAQDIPEKTREAVYAMRQYIDRLSTQYAEILDAEVAQSTAGLAPDITQGILQAYLDALVTQSEDAAISAASAYLELNGIDDAVFRKALLSGAFAKAARAHVIRGNIGEYVHRSYQAFDDKKWFQKLDDKTINSAREYLINGYMGTKTYSLEDATKKAEVTLHELVKSGTAYDSMGAFVREGKLGAKDLSIMIRRKVIAPEIRALLGEYKDARLNYAKSATKMGRLIWNQRFLDGVRKRGMGVFLFEGDDRPPQATKQISAESTESYAPLNGLWTFPDVEQSFRDALGKEHMDQWYETIVQLNGMVKFGKTVLSPTTAARNWQSALLFTIANGHFDLKHIAKSISGLREYFTNQGDEAKLAYLRELQELGVVYDNPYAGEMMRLLGDSKIEDTLLKGKDPMKFNQALTYAQKFYQYGDDFWKIVGFENEKNMLMKHAGMNETEAKKEAAKRVRDTYPTYSMVGRAMNFLRRFPLAGTFVSFPSEIIRTVGNMIRYTAEDYKNPKLRPLAIKRMWGLGIASGFAYALQAMTMAMLGLDDDDEEAVRDLSPTWGKNSNFLFIGRNDKGQLQYFDLSYVDPYNYFKRPITAILRDQPWEKIAADVFRETLQPFLGSDIAAGAIFEVLANKKESGGRIYLENGKPLHQAVSIANHMRKALQPGAASNLERTYKALAGEVSMSGKKYDPMEEAAGWLGWRISTLDSKVALYYRTFEFTDQLREASSAFNRVARDPNSVSSGEIRNAVEHTRSMREDAFREMSRIVSAVRSSGMTNSEIFRVLKSNNVSRRDISALLRGDVPLWRPTMQSSRAASQRADVLLGPGMSKEFAKRYREAAAIP